MDKNNLEQIKNERIGEFKKAFSKMIATNDAAYSKSDARQVRFNKRRYTKEDINRIVESGDIIEQARLSEFFFKVNGIYKRIITHYATFLRYAWILVPHIRDKKTKLNDKKNSNAYYNATDFCSSFQIERKCALFMKDVLVKGAYYGLLQDSGDDVVIQDLPFEYCRSRYKNTQDIDIVEFDMRFFDTIKEEDLRKQILKTYPKIVQKGYYAYKNRGGPKWIFLPAEMGVYFCFFNERPFFLDLIPLLDDLEDYKDIDKERNLQSLKRILTQTIPIDKGELVFEPDEAETMHQGVVEMLRNNPDIDIVTSYANIDLLDISSDADEVTAIDDVLNLIYESAGVTKELFCATTEAGLEYSMNNDLAMLMVMGNNFAHFFTMLIDNKFSNKKLHFELIILPVSYYNSQDYTSEARQLATLGYSFLTPILTNGINQNNLADLKELENELLNLDEVLKPLQTSYTQSGKVGDTPSSARGETTTTTSTTTDANEQDSQAQQNDNQTQQNDNQTNNTTSQNTNNDGD